MCVQTGRIHARFCLSSSLECTCAGLATRERSKAEFSRAGPAAEIRPWELGWQSLYNILQETAGGQAKTSALRHWWEMLDLEELTQSGRAEWVGLWTAGNERLRQ